MRRSQEHGRSRVTVMVLLGLGIALLGALLLPRLLNEARPPEARLAQASVCFAVLGNFTLPEGGTSRLAVGTPGRPPLQVATALAEGTAPAAMATAAAEALRGAAAKAGWAEPLTVAAASNCIHLESVVSVGGDPGIAGLGVSYALAARGAKGGPLRIHVSRSSGEGIGPTGRLGLSARQAAAAAATGESAAAIEVAFEGGDAPEAIIVRLGERLGEAGWTYAMAAGDLVVRGLPDGGSLGGLMLSVQYDEVPTGPAAVLTWTLSMER